MASSRLRFAPALFAAGLLCSPAPRASAQPGPSAPQAGTPDTEVVGPGALRVHRQVPIALRPQKLQNLLPAGKSVRLDHAAAEMVVDTFTDLLPAGWLLERPEGLPPDARIDSFGNPIVNDTPGLPAWAQRDVDALRAEIARSRAAVEQERALGRDPREAQGVLGNFIAQAITRDIDIDDIVRLEDADLIPSGAGETGPAILGYLHFYENIRFLNQEIFRYAYSPTNYHQRVRDLITRLGGDLARIQELEQDFGGRGGQPSGCYARTAFARGMTNLSGQTDIWVANGFDDESADIPTGLSMFFFYDCQNPANNDTVRVSTNGYFTFFQQGGGTLDGRNFTNDPIPDAADTPNGYAAPWWDDLVVATAQGSTDRVSYKTEGAIDSRVFTVEWISMSRLNGSTTDFHYFQVKLYETTDLVELHYGLDVSGWSPDTLDDATSGIENYAGAGGDCGPNCLNTNGRPPPNDYRFTPAPRPDNDACGNAIELINGASITGNLHRATPDGNANCGDSSNNRDVWYTFVARCNGTLHLDTCGSRDINGPGTGIDTVLSVHSGCPGTIANQLACNDDAGAAGCSGTDSAVTVPMVTGQRVFIRVTHFGDIAFRFVSGAFRLNLDFVSTSAPANDSCAAATTILNGQSLVGNLLCASNDGSSDCGSAATNPDIWYRFTAPRPGRLKISLCGSRNNSGVDTGPDTSLSIHSACPGTIGNQLICNDDGFIPGCNSLDSTAEALLSAGQTVRIRVTHFGSTAFRVGNGFVIIHADFECAADFNHDGFVDFFDFNDFVDCFEGGPCPPGQSADFNGDGFADFFDFNDFVDAFELGC